MHAPPSLPPSLPPLHYFATVIAWKPPNTNVTRSQRPIYNDLSCTVVLERALDDKLIKQWQLACEEDIAHVVVMPNVTKDKIHKFVEELVECTNEFGRMATARKDSPLANLQSSA